MQKFDINYVHLETFEGLYELLKNLFENDVKRIQVGETPGGGYRVSYELPREPAKKKEIMTPDHYQFLSRRTQNPNLCEGSKRRHALYGLASEVGEIHSIFQHEYQGKPVQKDKVLDECSDLCWFLCELLDTFDIDFSDVLQYNVEKLKKRYPEGFDPERSKKRHEEG